MLEKRLGYLRKYKKKKIPAPKNTKFTLTGIQAKPGRQKKAG